MAASQKIMGNTITRAVIQGEDKLRKDKMIEWLKDREMLSTSAETYLETGTQAK
jgi:Asp-tRNA(Asn)/Glu-tRNA(Gln) amidotransferase C subunit